MKRYGSLWQQVVSWPNLLLAAKKARRGKRQREVVQRFHFEEERHLFLLQEELQDGGYRPGPFTTHRIARPKSRLISAAPYRDRVVHHAVMNVLTPLLDRHFHPDSYACRPGRGTHAASRRLQQFMRRERFTLQGDIRQFFPSIDHGILKECFRHRLKDGRVLDLLDCIVDGSNEQDAVQEWYAGDELWAPFERRRGLPIGNLTSQWFANWYLDEMDQIITQRWRVGSYLRYCDDFVLLHTDRHRLWEFVAPLITLLGDLRLKLHEKRLHVMPCRFGRRFVGYLTFPTHHRLSNAGVRRFLRRLRWLKKAFRERRIDRMGVHQRLLSWFSHALHANCGSLLGRMTNNWTFRKGRFHCFHDAPWQRQLS